MYRRTMYVFYQYAVLTDIRVYYVNCARLLNCMVLGNLSRLVENRSIFSNDAKLF